MTNGVKRQCKRRRKRIRDRSGFEMCPFSTRRHHSAADRGGGSGKSQGSGDSCKHDVDGWMDWGQDCEEAEEGQERQEAHQEAKGAMFRNKKYG